MGLNPYAIEPQEIDTPWDVVMRSCSLCGQLILARNALWPTDAECLSLLAVHVMAHAEEEAE